MLRVSTWTSTKRILLFEFNNAADSLTLRLYVGPGEQPVRERLFAFANSNQPPFRVRSKKLDPHYCTLFSQPFLSPLDYEVAVNWWW
jgi:hypothetical protein